MSAQTSNRISSIASNYARVTAESLKVRTATPEGLEATARDIRGMAASLLRQDEVRGLRKVWRKVSGR